MNYEKELNELKAKAAAQMAAYPQYNGHFDNYGLALAHRRIKTKAGVAMEKGELVILAPREILDREDMVTIYSMSNRIDTSVPRRAVAILIQPKGN